MVEKRSQESQKEKEWTMEGYVDSEKSNCQNKALRSCQEVELRLRAGNLPCKMGRAVFPKM